MKHGTAGTETLKLLMEYFEKQDRVSAPARKYFMENVTFLHVKKHGILIPPGMPNENLYFIGKGVVRAYIEKSNKEITTWIASEGRMAGTIRNFGTTKPSNEIVQTLEDCDLIAMPITTLDYMYDRFPETNQISRKILGRNLKDAEERSFIARLPTAEDRYERFLETQSQLINRIPLRYIASYLNMSIETLSRIRSRQVQKPTPSI